MRCGGTSPISTVQEKKERGGRLRDSRSYAIDKLVPILSPMGGPSRHLFQNLGRLIQQQKRILWRKDLIRLFVALAETMCRAQEGDISLMERVCSEFGEGGYLMDCFDVEGYFLAGVEVEETDF